MNGARWVQETLLGDNPKASLRVYAVWFNMYPGDARERWRADRLTDPRVAQFWDERRSIGLLFYPTVLRMWAKRAAETIPPQDDALWDAYLLYGPRARWTDQPPDVVSWGATILSTRETLERDLKRLLKN